VIPRIVTTISIGLLLITAGFSNADANVSAVDNTNAVDSKSTALLTEQLQGVQTLQAQFQQTISNDKGQLLQQASGKLIVKKPQQLYWLTEQPYEHLVVTDGTSLWLYDIDLEQVNKENYNNNIDKAPALLLSGDVAAIQQNYQVAVLEQGDDEISFTLKPNASDSAFSQLTISFKQQKITRMVLKDNFDQTTTIDFSDVELNQPVSDQQFAFTPPVGVEVIENER
tara:strand:+ start:37470 stop:38147 length:678 start_codon:yes stop_codon:yes gene_type:complete